MADLTPILPAHIEETVQSIARLHAEHYRRATPLQRTIDRLTASAGRPSFVAIVTILVVGWLGLNVILPMLSLKPIDKPPFASLQGVIGLAALYMTMLILTTQRHDDELASHREQLTLELAILSEQKSAKIIELLEELRRDSPHIDNRHDAEAMEMSKPADPQAVLDAIKDTHAEMMTSSPKDVELIA